MQTKRQYKQRERQPTESENVFTNHISDKGLVSRM